MQKAGRSKLEVQIIRTTMDDSVVVSKQTLTRWYVDDLDAQAAEIAAAEAITASPTHSGGVELLDDLTPSPESA